MRPHGKQADLSFYRTHSPNLIFGRKKSKVKLHFIRLYKS